MRFLEVNVQYTIGISQYSHNIAAVFLVDYLRDQIRFQQDSYEIPWSKSAVYYRNIKLTAIDRYRQEYWLFQSCIWEQEQTKKLHITIFNYYILFITITRIKIQWNQERE